MKYKIKYLKKIFFQETKNLNKNTKTKFFIHKDKVGFFVSKKLDENIFELMIYGKIKKEEILEIKKLFLKKSGTINIKIIEINDKFIKIETKNNLEFGDFLMYLPKYLKKKKYIIGPYFDNLISRFIYKKYFSKYSLFSSIDEESSLLNTNFEFSEKNIILDTIWQDYTNEKIDFSKIYNVYETNFKIGKKINHKNIVNIKLDLSFKTEFDFFPENTYFLLCPIENGHYQKSKIYIKSINNFRKVIKFVLKNI